MKVSQAIQFWTGYHKLNSKKKYPLLAAFKKIPDLAVMVPS